LERGVAARVDLSFIVNVDGHVNSTSVTVVRATDHDFIAPARATVVQSLYWPGCLDSRAVRVLFRQPFVFQTNRGPH